MNNLVDYEGESDDESPRRRSSEGQSTAQKFKEEFEKERKRRASDVYGDEEDSPKDFAEPPAPKRLDDHSPSPAAFRTPVIGMPHAASTTSLVSYSGDGDDDDEDSSEPPKISGATPISEIREPAPPPRQSRDVESDEEQELIDRAIKEGNEAILRMNIDEISPSDTPGRDSVVDSPFSAENFDKTPTHQGAAESTREQQLKIPPPPEIEVNPAIATRFEHAFRQKALGTDLNQQIQGNQQYNNPMSYTTFIDAFEIDEKGTNFAKNIFDPHVFPDNCFYDAIADEQKKIQEQSAKKK
ncbi:Early ELOngation arrest [Caenorhabditis elegans]|uniref:Early ELOngation arrest n=1 Tax=Caenorhabditis elegans TaxID=6239 RepID=Q9BKQ7_CAEEL|nr:Early ELOngation arrest [Caenorhabditis elegans]CCD73031.1 Early ELOngation arrest [Caenorhabditis elegans]|eukprot:NP_497421.2 Uncharacterized protein CELE_Y67D2.7 [Caenorhabditis elegans]